MFTLQNLFAVYSEAAESQTSASVGAPAETQAQTTETTVQTEAKQTTEAPKEDTTEEKANDYLTSTGWGAVVSELEDKPALSMAMDFVAKAGISLEDPAVQLAAKDGDFSMLEAKLAAEGVQGYEAMLAILKSASDEYFAEKQAQAEADVQAVQNILGENHAEIWDWAKGSMDETDKEVFNGLFEQGGHHAIVAGIALKALYEQNFEGSMPAESLTKDLATSSSNKSGAITRQEFASLTQELAKKYGSDVYNSREYQMLQQRRELGRRKGI